MTSIFAARRQLRTLLETALPLVTVAYGDPSARDDLEQVTITGYGPIDGDTPMIGPREERYAVELVVSVLNPDADAEEVDVRTEEIVNVVLATVKANQKLGGAVNDARVTGMDTIGAIPADTGGSICGVTIDVQCWALV